MTEFLGRARYERVAGCEQANGGMRNGYRDTTIKTTAGPVTVARPKLRGTSEVFCSRLFGAGVTKSNALQCLVIAGFVRGLSVRDVGFILEACVDGARVGGYRQEGDEIDLVIVVDQLDAGTTREVGDVPIHSPIGKIVPLISVVSFKQVEAPQQINHIEELPSVSLRISPPQAVPLETAMAALRDEVINPLRASGVIPAIVVTLVRITGRKRIRPASSSASFRPWLRSRCR